MRLRWRLGEVGRAVALLATMGALAPTVVAGCAMLDLGQSTASSSTSTSTTSSTGSGSTAKPGQFNLELNMTQSSCGNGALGLQQSWSFAVTLAHTDGDGTWTSGGSSIDGTFDPTSRAYAFEATHTIDMRADAAPGSAPLPACSIIRVDDADLTVDSATTAKSLTGQLVYSYTIAPNSNCADLIYGETPQFAMLPCAVAYSVTGTVATK